MSWQGRHGQGLAYSKVTMIVVGMVDHCPLTTCARQGQTHEHPRTILRRTEAGRAFLAAGEPGRQAQAAAEAQTPEPMRVGPDDDGRSW